MYIHQTQSTYIKTQCYIQHQTQCIHRAKHNVSYNKVPTIGPKKRGKRSAVKCNLIINETVVQWGRLPLRDREGASP